jgi:hypothetical protein
MASGKGNTYITDLLNYVFNATAFSWNATTLHDLHLHTANPGATGNTSTSEATYTNYALVTVARTSGGWTVSGQTATNAALIQFPQCGVTGNTITYVSIGVHATTEILYFGALNSSLAVANLIQPQFAASSLTITES